MSLFRLHHNYRLLKNVWLKGNEATFYAVIHLKVLLLWFATVILVTTVVVISGFW